MSFGWDGEHSLDRLGMFGMAQCGVAEQRVDSGEPGVAGGHAVGAIGLQMGEERGDEPASVRRQLARSRDASVTRSPQRIRIIVISR